MQKIIINWTSTNFLSKKRLLVNQWCLKGLGQGHEEDLEKILKPFSKIKILVQEVDKPTTNVDKKKDLKPNKSTKSSEKKNDTNLKPNELSKDPETKKDVASSTKNESVEIKKNDTNVKEDNNGTKTNPIGFRLGVIKSWESRWFSEKDYSKLLQEDINIRKFLMKKLASAGISKVVIERPAKLAKITIHTSRPGVIIGKKGSDIEKLKKDISKTASGNVSINIVEIKKPELDSQLVADNIAQQLERRVAFRRAMKRAVQSAMRLGALGIRVNCSGRLGGAEIARTEWYKEGRVPLHTLRADIDYGVARANTTYGICGVKVWIFKGEKFDKDLNNSEDNKVSNDELKKVEEK